jgi:hypothetical protein
MERKLKGWLKPNPLTDDETDFQVVIESFGSIAPKGIIEELVTEGMELKPETVLDVVTRYNRKCIEFVTRGYSVNTGIVSMRPVVKGVFYDKKWNPEEHKLYVAVNQGAELRAAMEATTVEIMGEHPDPIALFGITDLSTGKTDGTLTRGFNAELKGTYIKVTGDDNDCGIYLRNTETAAVTKLEERFIAVNDPSKVMIIVPQTLDAGSYELHLFTQYTVGSKLLNSPRSTNLPFNVEIS